MKLCKGNQILTMAAGLAVMAAGALAGSVEVGDSYEDVIDELGRPASEFSHQGEQTLTFLEGKVELKDGKVVSAELVSRSEARKQAKEQEAAAVAAQEEKAKAAAEKRQAGEAAKKKALENKDLSAMSPAAQLQFWRDFKRSNPGVNVRKEIASANKARQAAQQEAADKLKKRQETVEPPANMSSRQRRKFLRGRSAAAREAAAAAEIAAEEAANK